MNTENTKVVKEIKICLGEIANLINNKRWRKKDFWQEKRGLLRQYCNLHDAMVADGNVNQSTVNLYQDAFEKFYNLLPVAHKQEAIKTIAKHKYVPSDWDEYTDVLSSELRSGIFTFLLEEKYKKLSARPTVKNVYEMGEVISSLDTFIGLLNEREKEIKEEKSNKSTVLRLNKIDEIKINPDYLKDLRLDFYTTALNNLKELEQFLKFIRIYESGPIFKNNFLPSFFDKAIELFEKSNLKNRMSLTGVTVIGNATVRSVFLNSGSDKIKNRFVQACETAIQEIKNPVKRIHTASSFVYYAEDRAREAIESSQIENITIAALDDVADKVKDGLLYEYKDDHYLRLYNEFANSPDFYRPIETQLNLAFDFQKTIKSPTHQFKYAARIYFESIRNMAEIEVLSIGRENDNYEEALSSLRSAVVKAKELITKSAMGAGVYNLNDLFDVAVVHSRSGAGPNTFYETKYSVQESTKWHLERERVRNEKDPYYQECTEVVNKYHSILDADKRELFWNVLRYSGESDIKNQSSDAIKSLVSNFNENNDFYKGNAPENYTEILSVAEERAATIEANIIAEADNHRASRVSQADAFIKSLTL